MSDRTSVMARQIGLKLRAQREALYVAQELLAAWDACDADGGWEPLNDPDLWEALRDLLAKGDVQPASGGSKRRVG